MSKEDFIKKISKESKVKRKKTAKIFDRVIELISKDIKKRRAVSIDDFGEFKIKRQELKVVHMKNSIVVNPPKDVIEFEVSDTLRKLFEAE